LLAGYIGMAVCMTPWSVVARAVPRLSAGARRWHAWPPLLRLPWV